MTHEDQVVRNDATVTYLPGLSQANKILLKGTQPPAEHLRRITSITNPKDRKQEERSGPADLLLPRTCKTDG